MEKNKSVIDIHELEENMAISHSDIQRLLQEYCITLKVCGYFIDAETKEAYSWLGNKAFLEEIECHKREEIEKELLGRIQGDSIEDQIVEKLDDDNGYIGVLAIKIEAKLKLQVVLYGCKLEESEFYQSLDLLRELLEQIAKMKASLAKVGASFLESEQSHKIVSKNFQKSNAMTTMVQLLDSEDDIETILYRCTEIIGNYLNADGVYIMQLELESDTMDILAQWSNHHDEMIYEKTRCVPSIPILYGDKPQVISADAIITTDLKKAIEGSVDLSNITAAMIYPILNHSKNKMCASIVQKDIPRTWSVEETLFTAEVMKVLHSILTRRIQEHSITSSYTSLKAILDNMICSICVKDKDSDEILFINQKFKQTFGPKILPEQLDIINNSMNKESIVTSCEIHLDKDAHWYDLYNKEISWVDGSRAILYSFYETTDMKLYQKKIEQQAYTDFLTGLYNRICCERDLAKQIDFATVNDMKGVLVYLDLDDFKHINDGIGHQYGDELLKALASDLQNLKEISHSCYRVGGDEFIIIIPPLVYDKKDEIIEEIKVIFKKPRFLKNTDYYCTSSIGMVEFPTSGNDVQSLIKKADIAMYEAKKSGKNKMAIFTENMNDDSYKRFDMEANMRKAASSAQHEFIVYYQPIMNVKQGKCVSTEALVRWRNKELGFVMPAEFIPLAEYLGLINPIGNYILKEACKQCAKWNQAGKENFRVGVNLSVVQLLQNDIIDIIKETLEETKINPANLVLEVTESLAINDMERMKQIISEIKKLGVRIALDDFGTGYSSLNHIREIQCDTLKVDRTFTKDLKDDAYSKSFIKVVKELSTTLGVLLCVEGVETKAQYDILKEMEVDIVQGYYFDRPMEAQEFEKKYINT